MKMINKYLKNLTLLPGVLDFLIHTKIIKQKGGFS